MTDLLAPDLPVERPSLEGDQPKSKSAWNYLFLALLFLSLTVALATLATLLITTFIEGSPRINGDLWGNFPSSNPVKAGAKAALWGTIWVVGVAVVITVPIGIASAIYLEEYARQDRWYNRFIEVSIQNLAAVPSIVYGILGLAFIVRPPLDLGRTVAAAGITLALVVLPTIIITSREAIRAVPGSLRQGAMALGATRWQATFRQVLPASIPGIATGVILATSRAIGEAAPLLLVGGLTFITFTPTGLDSPFTVLPLQIFNWISRPQDEFRTLAAAACMLLLVILVLMNALAILLRNRFQKKW